MDAWRPIPRALITEVGRERYTRENPAPRLVGFCWALDQLMDGYPPSINDLAAYAGWTTWKARTMLARVRQHAKEWKEPRQSHSMPAQIPQGAHTPEPNDSAYLEELPAQEPHSAHNGSAHRAHVPTEQDKNTTLDLGGDNGTHVDKCWQHLETVRLKHTKRGRRRKIGEHHETLARILSRYSEADVLHAWRWWWESGHHIPAFCKKKNLDYGTFLNPTNHRRYQSIAENWKPGETETTDLDSFLNQATY